MTYYYPYSTTYLSQKMRHISVGILRWAIFGTSAVISIITLQWVFMAVAVWFQ
jgi:hypothetical protein